MATQSHRRRGETCARADCEPETVVEGYFYGPIDLDFDPAGEPNIVYHDHQDRLFDMNNGDLTWAVPASSGWTIAELADDGDDGWDDAAHRRAADGACCGDRPFTAQLVRGR